MKRASRRARLPLLLFAVAGVGMLHGMLGGEAVAGPVSRDAPRDAQKALCAEAVADVENRLGIPAQLLSAISLAESGRWDSVRRMNVSWPWAIYAQGRPYYPPDKRSAIAKVRSIMARGVSNIDVGCLQINLFYHPDAFDSLDEAFDPAANAAYAGDLLLRLRNTHRSWSRAIAFYHSSTREFAIPYLRRVQRLWLIENRRQAARLRDKRLETLRLKKAEREANQAGGGRTATFRVAPRF